jgi:hypothetical protein
MGMVSIVVMERKRREGRGKEERVESNKLWKIILAERLFGQSTYCIIQFLWSRSIHSV